MSLRWKLALAVAALSAAATLLVGAMNFRATADRLMAEVDRSLADASRSLVPEVARGRGALPLRGPLTTYDAQVLDRTGAVARTTFEDALPVVPDVERVVGRPGERVVATVEFDGTDHRVMTIGTATGALQVARPLDEVERVLAGLRIRNALAVLLVAAAAAVVALAIAGRATAPLRRLTAAAETVESTGRLDAHGVVGTDEPGRDEVGRLATAFAGMLDALRRSRHEQQRLVDDAGHELRTPLTSIRTNLAVLRRYPDMTDEQRRELLADLESETDELVTLVDEIVTVARGANDEEPVSDVALGELVAVVAERAERRSGRAVRVTADASVVRVQPAGLQRAVANLLDNARKFDRREAPDPPLEVVVDRGVVEVLDRGPGIPDDDLPQVFERFHRADAARSMPGSGLGLAIVRDVVERNGGRVHARNRTSGGAAVGFTLPLVDGDGAPPFSPDS